MEEKETRPGWYWYRKEEVRAGVCAWRARYPSLFGASMCIFLLGIARLIFAGQRVAAMRFGYTLRGYTHAPGMPRKIVSQARQRVYCMVPTRWNAQEQKKWDALLDTWGPNCDVLKLFVPWGDQPNKSRWVASSGRSAPVVALNLTLPIDCGTGSCRNIWDKVRSAWQYVYNHDFHLADWYVKADTDTYLWPSNLRAYVRHRGWNATREAHFFGHVLRQYIKDSSRGRLAIVAGSSTVLSALALRKLVEALPRVYACRAQQGVEELSLASCLRTLQVFPKDAFDDHDKEMFMIFDLDFHLSLQKGGDWWYYSYNPQTNWGKDCCSDRPIAFHYLTPEKMRAVHGYINRISVDQASNALLTLREIGYLDAVIRSEGRTFAHIDAPWFNASSPDSRVPCQRGTYYSSLLRCERCPEGKYQDSVGESRCKNCPPTRPLTSATAIRCTASDTKGRDDVCSESSTLPCEDIVRLPMWPSGACDVMRDHSALCNINSPSSIAPKKWCCACCNNTT